MNIGFFDSGIGGITVLKEALRLLPKEDYIYYADTKHVPYGTKTPDEVKKYVFQAVDFIIGQGVKALVVACNTATSIAISDLRREYDIPIIGMEPAVKPAVVKSGDKRVLVTATPLTLKKEKYHELVAKVDAMDRVDSLPLPELVEYAEDFIFNAEIIIPYLKDKLSPFDMNEYGTIVLGCTHFPFFKKLFKEVLPEHVNIIDGNIGTIKHLKHVIEERYPDNIGSGNGTIKFYSSGKLEASEKVIGKYLRVLE